MLPFAERVDRNPFPLLHYLAALAVCIPASLLLTWLLVPRLGEALGQAAQMLGNYELPVRYATDLAGTFLVYFIVALLAIRLARTGPYVAALPIGAVGLAAFWFELGGLRCVGQCGLPYWYDLLSFLPEMLGALAAAGWATRWYATDATTVVAPTRATQRTDRPSEAEPRAGQG